MNILIFWKGPDRGFAYYKVSLSTRIDCKYKTEFILVNLRVYNGNLIGS